MPGFRLTKAAKADMLEIGRYTRRRWGRKQMRRHVGDIDDSIVMVPSSAPC